MTTPRIGVLALQGSFANHQAALEKLGAEVTQVRRRSELDAIDGLVIPGGESTTIARLLRVFELDAPLRARIGAGLPVYGTCAGMILLANRVAGSANAPALGGMDVLVRRNAFGRQAESFETDLEIAGVADGERGGPMRAVFIRAPLIEQVGDQVQVLARLPKLNAVALDLATVDGSEIYPPDGELEVPDGGTQLQALDSEVPNIVVAARQGNLLATAFHPEVTDDLRLHEYFLQMC